jgi:cysteine synthase
VISIDDVERAAQTIGGRVHRTPLLRSATLSDRLGAEAHLKAELFQRTGSFKVRGALNRIAELTDEERARGVISISAGNHAQAVAWAAREAGLDALIVMWQGADALKVAATRGYGAAIDQEAAGPTQSFARLEELIAETGRTLVHPFNDEAVVAGQGTVALEILDDLSAVDVVVVPVGGGGLVSGVATAVKARRPDARVIAVEPERSTKDSRPAPRFRCRPRAPLTRSTHHSRATWPSRSARSWASSRCSSRRTTSPTHSVGSTPGRSSPASLAPRRRRPHCSPKRCVSSPAKPSSRSSRAATLPQNRPLLSWLHEG